MKISIIGTGMIANETAGVLRHEARGITISSICAHSNTERAIQMADKFHINKVYDDYAELLRSDDCDFVYIALANTAHYAHAKAALEAGRNVIVEKPITITYPEAAGLIGLAREKGLFLFEAMSLLHTPNFEWMKSQLPKVGPVRLIQANFSQYSSRYDRYLRGDIAPSFNPGCGGGALMDLNIYNLNAVIGLFGKPQHTAYFPNRGYNGIDTSGVVLLDYGDKKAVCTAAKDSSSPSYLTIQGEKGYLKMTGTPNEFASVELHTADDSHTFNLNQYSSRLTHEFMAFKDMWEQNDHDAMETYQNISLKVMETLSF